MLGGKDFVTFIADVPKGSERRVQCPVEDETSPRKWFTHEKSSTYRAPEYVPTPGRIIAVFSTKGGVGKTFVATNLAVLIARRTSGHTVLVDADLKSADVGLHLDLEAPNSVVDVVPYAEHVDLRILEEYAVVHRPSGLRILLGPPTPETANLILPCHFEQLLRNLSQVCRICIVDMSTDITCQVTVKCLECATDLVLVVTQDAAALRQTKILLYILQNYLGLSEKNTYFVLNRYRADAYIKKTQIEQFLRHKMTVCIPDESTKVDASVFQGTPVVTQQVQSIVRPLEELADMFAPRNVSDSSLKRRTMPVLEMVGRLFRT
ncbi:MAG: P-loop NTPase [Bacillota bacterium]